MPELTVPTILNTAADLIEERGWTQGKYRDRDGCLCALGGIALAITPSPIPGRNWTVEAEQTHEFSEAVRAVRRVIGNRLPNPIAPHVDTWNDAEHRTQQEVVDVLRAAAKAAEQVPA